MRRAIATGTITWNGTKKTDTVYFPTPADEKADLLIEIDDSDGCGQDLVGTLQVGASDDVFCALKMPTVPELDTFEPPSIAHTKSTHVFYGPLPGSIVGRYGGKLTLTAASAPTNEKETVVKIWEVPRY